MQGRACRGVQGHGVWGKLLKLCEAKRSEAKRSENYASLIPIIPKPNTKGASITRSTSTATAACDIAELMAALQTGPVYGRIKAALAAARGEHTDAGRARRQQHTASNARRPTVKAGPSPLTKHCHPARQRRRGARRCRRPRSSKGRGGGGKGAGGQWGAAGAAATSLRGRETGFHRGPSCQQRAPPLDAGRCLAVPHRAATGFNLPGVLPACQ
jgi:hypothetical protein